jgi:hypothetical protein
LEDRLVPAAFTWIGGAPGAPNDWNTAANWVQGQVPPLNDPETNIVIDGTTPGIRNKTSEADLINPDRSPALFGRVEVVNGATLQLNNPINVGDFRMSGNSSMNLGKSKLTLISRRPGAPGIGSSVGAIESGSNITATGALAAFRVNSGTLDFLQPAGKGNNPGNPGVVFNDAALVTGSPSASIVTDTNITLKNNATILNAGTFQLIASSQIVTDVQPPLGELFRNSGQVIVTPLGGGTAPAGITALIGVPFRSVGAKSSAATVTVSRGNTLEFRGGGNSQSTSFSAKGGTITFAGLPYTWNNGTILKSSLPGGIVLKGKGTVSAGASIPTDSLLMTPGSQLTNNGTVLLFNQFDWQGGTIVGGHFTTIPGAVVNFGLKKPDGDPPLLALKSSSTAWGILQLEGGASGEGETTANFYAATLEMYNSTQIVNQGIFTLYNDDKSNIITNAPSVGNVQLINTGVFQKLTGTNTSNVLPLLDNSNGKVLITSGTIKAPNLTGSKQNVTLKGSGKLNTDGYLNLVSGQLWGGSSELFGDVVSTSGQVFPGSPGVPGKFTVDGTTGSYTQLSGASLSVNIGGYTPGSGFDQLAIAGQASLAGTLNIAVSPSFSPQLGDSFQIITYGSHVGDFQTVNGLSINSSLPSASNTTPPTLPSP